MPNVFYVLRKDHEEVLRALAELESGPAGTSAGADQRTAPEKLVEQLIIEESKHEAVEEEYFWPAVRDRLPGGDSLADHAVEQAARLRPTIRMSCGRGRLVDHGGRRVNSGLPAHRA